jgi:hypothetical protein
MEVNAENWVVQKQDSVDAFQLVRWNDKYITVCPVAGVDWCEMPRLGNRNGTDSPHLFTRHDYRIC